MDADKKKTAVDQLMAQAMPQITSVIRTSIERAYSDGFYDHDKEIRAIAKAVLEKEQTEVVITSKLPHDLFGDTEG